MAAAGITAGGRITAGATMAPAVPRSNRLSCRKCRLIAARHHLGRTSDFRESRRTKMDSSNRGPIRIDQPADVDLTDVPVPSTGQQGADGPPRRVSPSRRDAQTSVVETFLKLSLAGGALAVGELEVKARTAGLLGEHRQIGEGKKFKAAKRRLGITSRRDGFGRGGEWFWQLSAPPSAPMPETLSSPAPIVPVSTLYDGSLPPGDIRVSTEARRADADVATDDIARRRVPLEWVQGVEFLKQRPRPSGIPAHRWRLFVEDCRRFLASPWAARARELGWETNGVFASRCPNPHEHLGSSGLLWNLMGGQILQIHRDGADLLASDGCTRTFHRRPDRLMTFLPWQ
jgi:hypothetical protein